MTTQTEIFPKTELDQAHVILIHLLNEEEKAETALDNAEKKVGECSGRVYKQRQVIAWLQDKMPPADPIVEGEEVIEDAEFLQIEGDVLDPITGEIVGKEALAEGLEPVADAMLEDLKDEGVIASDGPEPAVSVVVAIYPGDNPVATPVGQFTRYGELVADYGAAAGIPVTMGEYEVIGEVDGQARDLGAEIAREDYGKRLVVVGPSDVDAAKDAHDSEVAVEESAA